MTNPELPNNTTASHTPDAQPPANSGARPAVVGARSARGSGQMTLQKRIHAEVRRTLDSYPGAWMVWCDPCGDWRPLLERVANDERMGRFPLLVIEDQIFGAVGGLQSRQVVQAALECGESFVLLVPAEPHHLGWLWAQALLAERTYSRSLREQLIAWGWRPPHQHVSEAEIAILARQGLQHDPATWGGGGLEPDLPLLLEVLAGGAEPEAATLYLLDLTIEQCGLPPLDPHQSARWRTRALAHLLVTQAYTVAPHLVGAANELLIAEGPRRVALDLLGRWIDSLRLSKRLPQAILEADKIAAPGQSFAEAPVKLAPVLSRAAEYAIFRHTCDRLAQKRGKALLQALAAMQDDLAQHAQSFWGDPAGRLDPALIIPWAELLRLSRAAQRLLATVPTRSWPTIDEAVQWFISGGWQLDVAGDEILRNMSRSTPELLAVIAPLRSAYRERWEQTLIDWSDRWTAAGCPTPDLPTSGEWLAAHLRTPRATAIVVIDALRYDLGAQLAAMINQHEGTERASVQAARAPLPTITALGMGLALPISAAQLQADMVGTRWRLRDTVSGANLSVAAERRAWLVAQGIVPPDGFVPLTAALQSQLPAPTDSRTRLFITDDALDRLGHDDELELLGTGFALERYRDLVMRLRDADWRHILIVTDHGFIHWSGSDEQPRTPPVPDPAYRSRRALAYAATVALPEPHASAPGNQWKILPARGASCWSAYGGLGYFHGGAALQEWIIPCLCIAWPGQARPVAVRVQAIPRILSQRPRVMIQVEQGSLFVEDALPRHVLVRILHATEKTVLFRSDQIEVIPGQTQVAVTMRLTPGASAIWDAPLQIEVRDALTDEVIASAASVLRTRLDAW